VSRGRSTMSALAASLAGIALILVGWEVAARLVGAVIVLPGPAAAMMALWAQIITPAFYSHLLATLLRALAGFAIAFVVGLAWGLVAGSGGTLRTVLRPLLVLIRATPVIAVILLALIWFRADVAPVVVTLLMVVPVIVENVAAGVRAASGELLEMASLFGVPRSRRLRQLTLPALRPYLFAGAHSGLGMAFKVTVAAEVLVQPGQALGGAMQEARFYLDTPRILALTVAVIALSAVAEAVLQLVERLASGEVRLGRGGDVQGRRGADRARSGHGGGEPSAAGGLPRAVRSAPELPPGEPNPVAATALSKAYAGHEVLADFSLRLEPGAVTVVLGPSGCGKTTLLRILAGLEPADGGSVERSGPVSFAFQEPRLLPWASVAANVGFVLPESTTRSEIAGWLAAARLPVSLGTMPRTLSGGMQTRLALARAFAYPAPLLLLDEPFQNLDLAVKLELATVVRSVTAAEERTTLMVTHDVVEALVTADRIVILGGQPARITAGRTIELADADRDPRSAIAQGVAAELYALLLDAE
jgi:ABC-type nitrate/sulfonate/bicarbonate transport system ATPase subunit/ABC-type nitrate/sulfonate/bicarbonate transport system permease component